MRWHSGLEPILRRNESLARRTAFRVGGPAAFFLEPEDEATFAVAYAAAIRSRLPIHILGGGSNILVSDDGVPGVVISTARLCAPAPEVTRTGVRVGAGTRLPQLVRWSAGVGLTGLEQFAGIPGTVGGAAWMNAGGRYGAIGDVVSAVWCVTRHGGVVKRAGGNVRWAYRATDIHQPIAAIELALRRDRPEAVRKRLSDCLAEKCVEQPLSQAGAGCFFKNPPTDSAGRLIERVGLKGHGIGAARVSVKHANFIVNQGGASATDVARLSETIRERVRDRFGVLLENEVCCWPSAAACRHTV